MAGAGQCMTWQGHMVQSRRVRQGTSTCFRLQWRTRIPSSLWVSSTAPVCRPTNLHGQLRLSSLSYSAFSSSCCWLCWQVWRQAVRLLQPYSPRSLRVGTRGHPRCSTAGSTQRTPAAAPAGSQCNSWCPTATLRLTVPSCIRGWHCFCYRPQHAGPQ